MKYRKVSRGRRMSTWKGNRNGSGNSKFKTRHRKMRGGATGATVGVDGIELYDCNDVNSHVGGPNYNDPGYDMHASENTNQSPNTPSIKEYNGTKVNTVFTGNTMKMGLFNRRSFFNRRSIFTLDPKHLHTMGLIQVITDIPDNRGCRGYNGCSSNFYIYNTGFIHSKTKYVFFGQLDAKGKKNGWGICYDVSKPKAGRIFIGYWKDGIMNGLGIEVDFNYDTANNKHEPVGIYYGHFSQGKRHGFGIYYDIIEEPNGKETLFETQHHGKTCILLDKSFDKLDEHQKTRDKEGFALKCRASLYFNSTPQGIDEYTEFFFKNLEGVIQATFSDIQTNPEYHQEEHNVFLKYTEKYKEFVDFCRSKLEDALQKYRSKKDKETIEAKEKELEKEKSIKFLKDLKSRGYITGDIVDPEEEAAKKDEITKCISSLKKLNYVIQTPEDIIAKEEEEKKKKIDQHEELKNAEYKLKEMENEIRILSQSSKLLKTFNPNSGQDYYPSLGRSNRGRRSFRNSFNSSRSSSNSRSPSSSHIFTNGLSLLRSLKTSPEIPAGTALESPGVTAAPAAGGGNLTRKNMRTNKRKKTRKFRKSRRGGRR